jgi:hypothetical protein
MEPHPESGPAAPSLAAINAMQVALAERYFGFASDETVARWVERYSAAFREIIRRDPSLVERFASDREAALGEAEAALHVGETHEA